MATPIPSALAIVSGSRALERRPNEPMPDGDLNEPPDFFDEDQKAVWYYCIQNAPDGLLKKLDRDILSIWVIARVTWERAVIEQKTTPLIVVTPNGGEQQSTLLGIINRSAVMMLNAAKQLGFSPIARTKISLGEDQNPAEALERALSNKRA